MLNWQQIDTVLLDMDGTLLDLHFDNHFWMQHLPAKLAERDGNSFEYHQSALQKEYQRLQGQLEWYCLDYWSDKLSVNIMDLKRDIEHLINMRDDVPAFLDALHDSGRKVVLVTNAHPDSLALKVEKTTLGDHIDELISTHEFGVTKESQELWQKLQQRLQFDPAKTLFVDDSLTILESAKRFGIKHLLAISNPDSKMPDRDIADFPAVNNYTCLLTEINQKS